eukprot:506167-Rhodomonas_salina.1
MSQHSSHRTSGHESQLLASSSIESNVNLNEADELDEAKGLSQHVRDHVCCRTHGSIPNLLA